METLKIASSLRCEGIKVLIEMNKKKVGKCFEYAESMNIHYISIMGSNEIESGILRIKNMKTKEENEVKIEEIVDFLKNN